MWAREGRVGGDTDLEPVDHHDARRLTGDNDRKNENGESKIRPFSKPGEKGHVPPPEPNLSRHVFRGGLANGGAIQTEEPRVRVG